MGKLNFLEVWFRVGLWISSTLARRSSADGVVCRESVVISGRVPQDPLSTYSPRRPCEKGRSPQAKPTDDKWQFTKERPAMKDFCTID